MKKRYRILLWILLALVLGAAAVVWLARDWPRRQVEGALARALQADVDLGRLEIRDRRTFVLHRLDVRTPRDYPWLDSLRADRLTVTGNPGGILQRRIESLILEGAVVTLRESAEPVPEREAGAGVELGRLVLENGSLVLISGGEKSHFRLDGEITGLGLQPGGEIRLRADRLLLPPLLGFIAGSGPVRQFTEVTPLDLGCPVEGVEIGIRLGQPEAAALLEARAVGGIPFRHRDREPLAFPTFLMSLEEALDGSWRFAVDGDWPGLATLDLEGGMEADGGSPRIHRVVLESAEPALLLFSLGLVSEGLAARGRARLTLEQTGAAPPQCTVEASAEHLVLPRVGESESGGGALPLDSLCPLELAYLGTLERDAASGDWLTAGTVVLSSPSAGELEAVGTLLFGGGSESTLAAEWNWEGPAIPALRRLGAAGFGLQWPKRYGIDGLPRAAGRISGPLGQPLVGGTVVVDGLAFCLESGGEPDCALELRQGTLSADFRFQEGRGVNVPGLSLRGTLRPGPLAPLPLTLSAKAHFGPSTLDGRFEELSVTVGELARIGGQGRWARGDHRLLTAAIRLEETNLPAIRRALVPLTGDLLPGYELEAALNGEFDTAYSAADGWTMEGAIQLGEAWFASQDGGRAVQGLVSNWQVTAQAAPNGFLHAEAFTTAGGFQLLWGSVFGDFQEIQPRIRFAAGLEGEGADDGRWWVEGDLQPLPGLRLRASLAGIGGPGRDYSASLAVDDLAVAFERCARLPLGDSLPLLTRIDAGGRIDASAEGTIGPEGAALRGQVRLDGLDFTGEERTMTVRGLDLDLPLDLAWGPPDAEGTRRLDGAARTGRMGFDMLRLDTITLQRTDSGLVVQGDTVSLEEAQSIPLLGGTVTFSRLTLAGLLGAQRRLETGLTLEGLQLAELSRALEWPPFEGELEGNLPRVVLSPTRLRVDGGGEISLFGGTVKIHDISGEEVLSRYPRLSFSAEFHEIDLARLTRTFDFGEITGILEGTVSECRLFAGTPVGFRAEMRTVPRDGVSQTINVKAINNIAIVGTGGRITIFDRGIHSLLDRYTYEQLGVKMRLERDMFYLRGTEQRGDRELFLKGRLPFRIDVVNAEPGKTVSFSTMLARFQALEFSQAVTETGGEANIP